MGKSSEFFHNPYRRVRSPQARELVSRITSEVLNIERRSRSDKAQKVFELTVEAIVSDVIHRHLSGRKAVIISRSTSHRKSRYRAPTANKSVPGILDVLTVPATGLLKQVKGSHAEGRTTVIRPTARLLDLIADAGLSFADFTVVYPELIVQKGREANPDEQFWNNPSKYVEYEDTDWTVGMRHRIRKINEHLERPEIYTMDSDVDTSTRRLRRIFTNKTFASGGRMFGGFWLPMSKRHRRVLRVEGERLVELDFVGMQAALLYAMEDLPLPENDVYRVSKVPRSTAKKLFAAMTFRNEPLGRWPKNLTGRVPVRQAAMELALLNAPIKHHLGTPGPGGRPVGHHLQFLESQIMTEAVWQCAEEGIFGFPIHDALLVPFSSADKAQEIMIEAFRGETGQVPRIERGNDVQR